MCSRIETGNLPDLSVASGESSQSDPRHVEQPDLPIVVRKSDNFLVYRDADPEQKKKNTSLDFISQQKTDKQETFNLQSV